jgi:SAM-dependent methyltransferase
MGARKDGEVMSIRDGLNSFLKKSPTLVSLKRNILDPVVHNFPVRIIRSLPQYVPYSSGSHKEVAELTILSANQIFPFINHLIEVTGRNRLASAVQIESLCADTGSKECADKLKVCLDKYGSDKSNPNNYHLLYGAILRDTRSITAVLEIGLGTNNADVVSNMGRRGFPGASLRAFRDVLPNALVFGADVDKRILFEEERIKTFYVDQTDLQSFDELGKHLEEKFDLIIDDGLHSPNANIATLSFALGKLKPGGRFVIEDINHHALPVWYAVAALLLPEYKPLIISTKTSFLFLVERADRTSCLGEC